jgi:deazaflavin-dependent oxidoreductase (nitroreductase family)
MAKFHQLPRTIFKIIKYPPQVVYALGFGPVIGRLVLLLITEGRVTGKSRVTPLQYERVGDLFYVGSSRGLKSDWVRNILANPEVEIRHGRRKWKGTAEVITNKERIIEFLEIRLQNHPRVVKAILKSNGISAKPSRGELTKYAENIVVVAIHPITNTQPSH